MCTHRWGNTITVGGNKIYALVIDKALMEERLTREAQEAGAVLALGGGDVHAAKC